jgi:hypothetical protein
MSAEPARRSTSTTPWPSHLQADPAPPRLSGRAVRGERVRRERHLRRRRRDLLEDVAIAFVLMVVALIATPGLGVVAIIAVPVALVLIGTVIAERRLRRRRQATARTPRRPARR